MVGEREEVVRLGGECGGELQEGGGVADSEVVGGNGCVVGDAEAFGCLWCVHVVVGGFALED